MIINKEIKQLLKGKSVLHLGVLGDWNNSINLQYWDFYKLQKYSKTALGADIDKKGIAFMKKKGVTNLVYADVEKMNLKKKFDVIFAADIIEHLNNIGLFFESCKKHMTKDSVLLISTPNPQSFNLMMRSLFFNVDKYICVDHTSFVHPMNIRQLASRYGLKVVKTTYYSQEDKRNTKLNLFSKILNTVGKMKPKLHQSYYILLKLR